MSDQITIDFTLGSRRLLGVTRQVTTWSFNLEEILAANSDLASPPPPSAGRDGVRILSAPLAQLATVTAAFPELIAGARQDYRRHYIDMALGFDKYMAQFSGKTRSGLRRKSKKLAEAVGGYTISEFRRPDEIEHFLAKALPLSARTYQARLLNAGLPGDPAARRAMMKAAQEDRMRCFLLEVDNKPIAYLALPVIADTLIYAHLGYDPDFAKLSPGTVLQMDALQRLFAEQKYRWFDFTEGDGAHKELFGTHSVECSSLILLRPSFANQSLLAARSRFDRLAANAKAVAARSGALAPIRNLLRA